MAQHFLAKRGIFAARRVKKSDMEALSRATGAKVVTNLDELSADDLGKAGLVQETKVGDEDMTYVKDCKNPKSVTVLIRGGTEHVVDESVGKAGNRRRFGIASRRPVDAALLIGGRVIAEG